MNSVPKLFSCSYADCWTEKHFSTEFGVLTPNHTHSHTLFWGCVSRWFGRALAWHARGHRFDPGILHQNRKHCTAMCGAFLLQICAKEKRLPWPERAAANAFWVLSLFSKTVSGKTVCLRYVIQRRCVKKLDRYSCHPVRPDAF